MGRSLRFCSPSARLGALLGVAALMAGVGPRSHAAEVVLSEFNNTGFNYAFDGFTQTVGPTSVRLSDPTNGWGGAGRSVSLNLSTLADGRLVVDAASRPGHAADNFTLELYDSAGNSGKWQFTAPPADGAFRQLVSQTTLSNPGDGIGDWQHLNLSQIASWNVLGQWASPAPFDMSFDRIAISNTAPAPPPYAGYEADAPWRAAAAARIDAIRKADMTVGVVDPTGVPLAGADVQVRMQNHEFGFGSAVQGARIAGANPADAIYRAKVDELFNRATLENDLKWPPWIGEWGSGFNPAQSKAAIAWLNARDVKVRGHNLVWPGESNLPTSVRTLLAQAPLTPAQQQSLRNAIAAHIADEAGQLKGTINSWDVVNEPRANHDVMDALPEGNLAMVSWFQAARQADPNAKLFLNEYDVEATGGATNTSSQQIYYDTLQFLKQNGAPIDGLGMQAHFSESTLTGPEQAWQIFDRFAALGLKMNITEFDFGTKNEALQAAYTRDFLTAVFAHEGFDEFTMWGFWEGAHWRPDAAMFRNDWSIKPNGEAFLDLVFNQWWTAEDLQTLANGQASLRGFKGDYVVTASMFGTSVTVPADLATGGATLQLVIPRYAGDFDEDGTVDRDDLLAWSQWAGLAAGASHGQGDANGDGAVDGVDLLIWQRQLGSVAQVAASAAIPEPASWGLATLALALRGARRRRGRG